MQENQKVYVKVMYVKETLNKVEIRADLVLFNFISDVSSYQNHTDMYRVSRVMYSDKLVVNVNDSNIVYELFICNYNEINNYLH